MKKLIADACLTIAMLITLLFLELVVLRVDIHHWSVIGTVSFCMTSVIADLGKILWMLVKEEDEDE